jgi:integrase
MSQSCKHALGQKQPSRFSRKSFDVRYAPKATVRRRKAPRRFGLEFTILTAARSGETLLAKKRSLTLITRWVVPPERMKAGREHRVPCALTGATNCRSA